MRTTASRTTDAVRKLYVVGELCGAGDYVKWQCLRWAIGLLEGEFEHFLLASLHIIVCHDRFYFVPHHCSCERRRSWHWMHSIRVSVR